VVDVTRSPFLNHRIARACVEYLAALEDDEAITPLVFLLQRWDPQISNAARRALVARVGQPRVDELTRVGRMIGEALARIAQGRGAGDTDMLLEAADALDPSGAGLIRLYAARASGSARAAQIARDVLADDQAARWHDAARGLVRPADGRHRVEILGLRVMRQLPVIEGAGLAVLAKIRNAGDSYLPGGGWDGGLRLRAVWKSPKGERLTAITPLRVLGENGLAPGAEQWVAAWTEAPRVPATIQHVSLRISCPRVPVKVTGAKKFLPLFQWSLVEHSLPPGELVFKGQHLVHGWGASPALSHGEVESDGTVTFVAMRRDPYVIGPGLADLKRALEITLVYEAVVPGDRDHVILETYFVFEPGVPFSANSWVRRKVPTNVVERLSAVLPPDGDKGLRRLRFDFGQKADLFRVHEIRIRAR